MCIFNDEECISNPIGQNRQVFNRTDTYLGLYVELIFATSQETRERCMVHIKIILAYLFFLKQNNPNLFDDGEFHKSVFFCSVNLTLFTVTYLESRLLLDLFRRE